jgi:hypothetical protein
MERSFYSAFFSDFLASSNEYILGALASNNNFSFELTQKEAWIQQIRILKETLKGYNGYVFFEYSIPRMGRRIDVVLIIKHVIFVLEFKVGEKQFLLSSIDQVMDYCLDLKNFHETSHSHFIAPILIATEAPEAMLTIATTPHNDNLLFTVKTNSIGLRDALDAILKFTDGDEIDSKSWSLGRYSPTPNNY